MKFLIKIGVLLFMCHNSYANPSEQKGDKNIADIFEKHFNAYQESEYYSGAALAIAIPQRPTRNFYLGKVSHEIGSEPISEKTLFPIGSITKSFTAAILLQLVAEKKLSLESPLKAHLPQYEKWGEVSVKSLLNMTSGLPNYSDTPLWNTQEYYDLTKVWEKEDLIGFAYPKNRFSPPLKETYFYSNTGYILAALIVEKMTGEDFSSVLTKKAIDAAQLKNTFYSESSWQPDIKNRLAHGYNYNQYDNPALVGMDVSTNNLSWAGAAGGVISNAEDILAWVKALFVENTVLTDTQKNSMQQMVSVETGKPLEKLSEKDGHSFALGLAQKWDKDIGDFWFYEGITLGYRALYLYTPCNKVMVASIFNSATNTENDHAGLLMKQTYQAILKDHPDLVCQKKH